MPRTCWPHTRKPIGQWQPSIAHFYLIFHWQRSHNEIASPVIDCSNAVHLALCTKWVTINPPRKIVVGLRWKRCPSRRYIYIFFLNTLYTLIFWCSSHTDYSWRCSRASQEWGRYPDDLWPSSISSSVCCLLANPSKNLSMWVEQYTAICAYIYIVFFFFIFRLVSDRICERRRVVCANQRLYVCVGAVVCAGDCDCYRWVWLNNNWLIY